MWLPGGGGRWARRFTKATTPLVIAPRARIASADLATISTTGPAPAPRSSMGRSVRAAEAGRPDLRDDGPDQVGSKVWTLSRVGEVKRAGSDRQASPSGREARRPHRSRRLPARADRAPALSLPFGA